MRAAGGEHAVAGVVVHGAVGDDELRARIRIPESYFIGADLTYGFMSLNSLMHWGDQKYKSEEQIRGLTYRSVTPEQAAENRASWGWKEVAGTAVVLGLVLGLYLYFSFWL